MSACALFSSPQASGLVDKVAMSSGGGCQLYWPQDGLVPSAPPQTPYVDLADGQKLGVTEAKTLGCAAASALSCLRGKPVKGLLKIFPVFADVLAYNTPLLPRNPATAVQSGQVLDIPVLSSGNHDEERAFVGGAQKVKPFFTAKTYPAYLKAAFGASAGRVACPTLAGNAALAAHGSAVYGAEFDDQNAPDVNNVAAKTFKPGAAHASDIPYLFDLTGKNLLRGAAQQALSNAMIGYWSSFARTGVPSAAGEPAWPKLTGSGGPTLQMNPDGIRTTDVAAEHHCGFWKTVTAPAA
jgi:para-nitrobenzyl esterase